MFFHIMDEIRYENTEICAYLQVVTQQFFFGLLLILLALSSKFYIF